MSEAEQPWRDRLDEALAEADAARFRIIAEARLSSAEALVRAEREWNRVAGLRLGWERDSRGE